MPRLASSIAVADPATRAPTMITSYIATSSSMRKARDARQKPLGPAGQPARGDNGFKIGSVYSCQVTGIGGE